MTSNATCKRHCRTAQVIHTDRAQTLAPHSSSVDSQQITCKLLLVTPFGFNNPGLFQKTTSRRTLVDIHFTNQVGGHVLVTDGELIMDRSFLNDGLVTIGTGAPATFNAPDVYKQWGGRTVLDAGTLIAGTVEINAGSLEGTGVIIGDVENFGHVAPGTSAGQLTIEGTYEQTALGILEIDIGGRTPGTQFDQLVVNGTLFLSQQAPLTVNLINRFAPFGSDVFTIVKAGDIVGSFGGILNGFHLTHQGGDGNDVALFNYSPDGVPETFLDSAPPALTDSDTAFFDFSSDEASVTYECSLDGAAFSPCTDPVTFTGLSDGAHTLHVRAIDNESNIDSTPALHRWTIDTTLPNTFIDSAPPALTNSDSATFDFSSNQTNVTYECSLDGASFNSCTDPVTFTGLADGSHTLLVRAIDNVGNVDPTPAVHNWTIDTVAPQTKVDGGPPPVTDSTNATFDFSSDDADVTYECTLDGAGFVSCTDPVTFTGLSAGDHTLEVRDVDKAGNVDATPAVHNWTIQFDTNAPPVVTSMTTTAADPGTVSEGQTVSLTGAFTDANAGDTHTAKITWGDGTFSDATVTGKQVTADHVYAEGGIYTVSLIVTDNKGATSNTLTTTVFVTGAGVQNGTLQILGTNQTDIVLVHQERDGSLTVFASFFSGSKRRHFDAANLDKIHVHLFADNDLAVLSGQVTKKALLDGGDDHDILIGGSGPNILVGGDGNDFLLGGNSRDLLIGGRGRDFLVGRGGGDLLITGYTDHDNNTGALHQISAEWSSNRDYEDRVANLTDGSGSGSRENGNIFLNDRTVHDDGASDIVLGGNGREWFLANTQGTGPRDRIFGLRLGELVIDIDPED